MEKPEGSSPLGQQYRALRVYLLKPEEENIMEKEPEPREKHPVAETLEKNPEQRQPVETRDGDHAGQPKAGSPTFPALSE